MHVPFFHHKENRYEHQEKLDMIGSSGQKRLLKSKISIIGLGALGTVVADILARAGVGSIHLIDRDTIDLSNLHRQHLYTEDDIGKAKAETAKNHLLKINSSIKITSTIADLTSTTIDSTLAKKDLIIDCTDNLETRFLLNDYCKKKKIPWIHASAGRDIGNIIIFSHEKNSPCFRCIYDHKTTDLTCETYGVLPTLTATIGSLQAQVALTFLLGKKNPDTILRLTLDPIAISPLTINQRKDCPLCTHKQFDYLEQKKKTSTVKMCGRNSYQISGKALDLKTIKSKLERLGKVNDYGYCLSFQNLTIFNDGRVLVKTENIEEAKILYSKYIGNPHG